MGQSTHGLVNLCKLIGLCGDLYHVPEASDATEHRNCRDCRRDASTIGLTAVTNELHSNAWLLVMIIFIWTPPHFWALAIHRRDEYAKVNIPMLPVTHGIEYTKTSIFLYTLLLSIVCILPVLVGMSSWIYLSASLVLNGGFVYHAWVLKYRDEPNMAMKTFKFSIYHLMILFVALLADHYLL